MQSFFIFLMFLFLALSDGHTMEIREKEPLHRNKTNEMNSDYFSSANDKKYISQPIKANEGIFFEIDRDFFPKTPQGTTTKILQGTRIIGATALGFLVSMPVTSQVMILVGDWVGAIRDTPAATVLAAYIGFKSSLIFTNVWDNWIKNGVEFLNPIYLIGTSKDREVIRAALLGKFCNGVANKSKEYYVTLGLLSLSAAAYAFPSLWQLLWSIEEKAFPRLGYFTMPPFYLSLAYVFYKVAKENLNTVSSSMDAENTKDILIDSVRKFKKRVEQNDTFRQEVYKALKREKEESPRTSSLQLGVPENSPLIPTLPLKGSNALSTNAEGIFLFSYLFLVHEDADHYNDRHNKTLLTQKYTEAIKNPLVVYRKQQIESMVNGFLGVGWLTLSSLLQTTFQSTLIKFGTNPENAYWISLPLAVIQSATFIKVTSNIYHAHSQTLVNEPLLSCCASQRIPDINQQSNNNDNKGCLNIMWGAIKGATGWVVRKTPTASNLGSGALLSLAELKRGLETFASYSYPEKLIGAGVPFIMGTLFLKSIFQDNTSNLYRRIVTNLPSRCLSLFDCCREAHELETLDMYADDAIDLIENLDEKTRELLYEGILHQQ